MTRKNPLQNGRDKMKNRRELRGWNRKHHEGESVDTVCCSRCRPRPERQQAQDAAAGCDKINDNSVDCTSPLLKRPIRGFLLKTAIVIHRNS